MSAPDLAISAEDQAALAFHFSMAARQIARHGVSRRTLPLSVNLVRVVAARFSVPLSEKTAAQAVPIMGAATGALINAIFMRYFRDVARGHFTIRRLERIYGKTRIEAAYRKLTRRQQTRRRRVRRRRLG